MLVPLIVGGILLANLLIGYLGLMIGYLIMAVVAISLVRSRPRVANWLRARHQSQRS